MPAGRPTAYTKTMADEIISLMATGLSLTASAADLGVHRDTLYEWEKTNPEFSDAIKLARAKRQSFLEKRLLSATEGPVVTSSIFALKNAAPDDWREKVIQEQTGEGGGPIQHVHKIERSIVRPNASNPNG